MEEIALCDHCLGRLFLEVDGRDNEDRGKKIRRALGKGEPKECVLCGGLFRKADEIAWRAAKELIKYDVKTIVVSSSVPKDILRREEEIWKKYEIKQSESIKKDINRSVGKKLAEIGPWKYDPETPEAKVVVHIDGTTRVEITPIYITGILLSSTLPKSEVRKLIKTAAEAIFGAEDVRIRVKGWKEGIKFVIEVKKPIHRHVSVELLEKAVTEAAGQEFLKIYGNVSAHEARSFLEGA